VLPVATTLWRPKWRAAEASSRLAMRQTDGSVVIEHVDDWGALLAGFLAATGTQRADSVIWPAL